MRLKLDKTKDFRAMLATDSSLMKTVMGEPMAAMTVIETVVEGVMVKTEVMEQ